MKECIEACEHARAEGQMARRAAELMIEQFRYNMSVAEKLSTRVDAALAAFKDQRL
jgi:hypothetical protein